MNILLTLVYVGKICLGIVSPEQLDALTTANLKSPDAVYFFHTPADSIRVLRPDRAKDPVSIFYLGGKPVMYICE